MKIRLFSIILFILSTLISSAQDGFIYGTVKNEKGEPATFINVSVKERAIGTATTFEGKYKLTIPMATKVNVTFSGIGYITFDTVIQVKKKQKLLLNVRLQTASELIDEVKIEDKATRLTTLTRLNPSFTKIMPSALGNVESLIKTLPGVSSNNELSSQYSVRGGNFDENLVYVNGIEIYRPILVSSGQQEGMSFINPDMVGSILFSAGGFKAQYADKMASVLDIKYKQPQSFGGAISASLLGGSASIHGCSKDKRFTHISGFRYKTTKYLLNSLKTKGNYFPKFMDFQTFMSYKINKKWNVKLLGNYAKNTYLFIPQKRSSNFGTLSETYQLNMYFEGNEVDKFSNYTAAFELEHKPTKATSLKMICSTFETNEQETFDILSEYWINEVDQNTNSESFGDSISTIGVGSYLKHARNFLTATVYKIEHKGYNLHDDNRTDWGIGYQYRIINDNLTEWKMVDSANFALPYNDSTVGMDYYIKSRNNINFGRLSAFIQHSHKIYTSAGNINITGGIRGLYSWFNKEFLASPRVSIAYKPDWENDFVFRFSSGYYYQPVFYKEVRQPDAVGTINHNIKSQKSIHFVLGSDYNFTIKHRPFKFTAEMYYKKLDNLISYNIDNVRIIYSGVNNAKGYATGLDLKVNGELVKGVDSWISLSLLQTKEKIDGHKEPIFTTNKKGENEISSYKDAGYIPRLTDQTLNLNVYFQDYLPGNPDYKVHLQLNYATGLPYSVRNKFYQRKKLRMPSYKRIDIGFSKVLKSESKIYPKGHFLHHINDAWLSIEVFNLLENFNAVSMDWIQDYAGNQYAIKNTLTGRRINLKLLVRFGK